MRPSGLPRPSVSFSYPFSHLRVNFVLQLNKYGFEKTSRPWVAILDYLYIKWLINKRFSTLTSLTQKNRWTWKVKNLNKFDLECKQVRQVVILRILKQFSRFDEFVIVFALLRQQLTDKKVAWLAWITSEIFCEIKPSLYFDEKNCSGKNIFHA